jgi:hypothetical protein
MATTAQAYGLIPIYHPSGQSRANAYTIDAAYNTAIYKGDPVALVTAGTITIGDGTSDALGVFAGVEYLDSNQKPVYLPYWPGAVSGATNIVAWVYDDQQNVYRVGVTANATNFTQASVGAQVDLTIAAGNTFNGISGSSVAVAPAAGGAQAFLRIIGFFDGAYDATNNPFPQLRVQIAQQQFTADKVSI